MSDTFDRNLVKQLEYVLSFSYFKCSSYFLLDTSINYSNLFAITNFMALSKFRDTPCISFGDAQFTLKFLNSYFLLCLLHFITAPFKSTMSLS